MLGGGGSAGHAGEIGVIAGVFEAGLDLTEADLIIGTSAGSTAIAWDELDDPDLHPDAYLLSDVLRRLRERGDLFAPVLQQDQLLPDLAGA